MTVAITRGKTSKHYRDEPKLRVTCRNKPAITFLTIKKGGKHMGFNEFKEKILSDKDLAEKAKDFKSLEEVVAFGKANGYTFTAEDITASGQLSDEELETVAGGAAFRAIITRDIITVDLTLPDIFS